ncbi:uncharacterized protein LOC144472989 [Augochlora pura]
MDTLYPNLNERFKSEGVCPICLMEMELAARYTCGNGHTICYRCKPYYYACPTCQWPLEMQPSPHAGSPYATPAPSHFMPHPLPPKFHEYHPTAPSLELLNHERALYPPAPSADQQLVSCSYANLGCWVKIPVHLIDLHESRCQFRPHLEEETVPTDVLHRDEDQVQCRHRTVGCMVRTSPWRISIHEAHCAYKDRFEAMEGLSESLGEITITSAEYGDPEELLECKYRRHGCMVQMPRRRKRTHQEKCNYRKYHDEEDDSPAEDQYDPNELVSCKWARYGCMVRMPRRRQYSHQEKCNYCRPEEDGYQSEEEYDPDEQVSCRWADYGCRVRPKRGRVGSHEEKCNYRMEECAFKDNGCAELIHPARKYAHERRCQFAN